MEAIADVKLSVKLACSVLGGRRHEAQITSGLAVVAVLLIGGSAYGAGQSFWRPVMPEFVIDVRSADTGNKAPPLMLIYGENGSDPFQAGTLAADQLISDCRTVNSLCVSKAGGVEFGAYRSRQQSLQIRLFDGNGNPIVGGVSWIGSVRPKQVRVTCDLRVSDVRMSCAVSHVIV